MGPALLYYGCHSPDSDALYEAELREWETQGIVTVRHAFSRASDKSEGCKYVQYVWPNFSNTNQCKILTGSRDRIQSDTAEFSRLFFDQGAKVYICGSPQLSEGVKKTIVTIWADHESKSEDAGWEWMRGEGRDRFATDVFL